MQMKNYFRLFIVALVFSLASCENSAPVFDAGAASPENGGSSSGGTSPGSSRGATGTASATLNWNIPQFRENGESLPLGDIAGYEIAYRKLPSDGFSSVTLPDNNTSSYVISDIPAGNYEFMIAVFDTEGLFSDYSDPILATLSGS